MAETSWTDPKVLAGFVVGVLGLAWGVWKHYRVEKPNRAEDLAEARRKEREARIQAVVDYYQKNQPAVRISNARFSVLVRGGISNLSDAAEVREVIQRLENMHPECSKTARSQRFLTPFHEAIIHVDSLEFFRQLQFESGNPTRVASLLIELDPDASAEKQQFLLKLEAEEELEAEESMLNEARAYQRGRDVTREFLND